MKIFLMLLSSSLLLACNKNAPLITKKSDERGKAQSFDNEAAKIDESIEIPIVDSDEEEKATEPAIIGGAYLYCDSNEQEVGCRLANVAESDWIAANKTPESINSADGSTNACPIVLPAPGSPYQLILEAERALQNDLTLQVDITLPQGQLRMTTSVNPTASKATEQRFKQGIALYASKGAVHDWPGVDRKTWSLWMPVKIPPTIRSFNEGNAELSETVELIFDDTVCSYKRQTPMAGTIDYAFDSCSRSLWQAYQTVRVKSLILRVNAGSAGVVLSTKI